jgi:hypothetical protein
MPESGTPEWLAQVAEEVLDPHVEIVDPHHHLWPAGSMFNYSGDELASDTTGGHNVVATMFMECQSAYREDGPEHLRSVGETEFVVAEEARMRRRRIPLRRRSRVSSRTPTWRAPHSTKSSTPMSRQPPASSAVFAMHSVAVTILH